MDDRLARRFYENNIKERMKTAEDNISLLQKLGLALQAESYINTYGWILDSNTWSYSSADSPTFVISINADMTTVLNPGMRIKLIQTTTKYFIVTAVGTYTSGATLVTVYGGTDYTLANATILEPHYSPVKAPFGFPLDPAKWSVVLTDTTGRTQATPTINVWYNLGSLSISIPIGAWDATMQVEPYATVASSNLIGCVVSFSTSNNAESNINNTAFIVGTSTAIYGCVNRKIPLVLAAKTTYYIIARTQNAATTLIGIANNTSPLIVTARCAYL